MLTGDTLDSVRLSRVLSGTSDGGTYRVVGVVRGEVGTGGSLSVDNGGRTGSQDTNDHIGLPVFKV